ncbi:hypothetical protein B0H13DRAFT_1866667 [Mycena leptocephala]|nr:hypothetical protein B0H13DRAFT_1866667 [Mycena leptocephala]
MSGYTASQGCFAACPFRLQTQHSPNRFRHRRHTVARQLNYGAKGWAERTQDMVKTWLKRDASACLPVIHLEVTLLSLETAGYCGYQFCLWRGLDPNGLKALPLYDTLSARLSRLTSFNLIVPQRSRLDST